MSAAISSLSVASHSMTITAVPPRDLYPPAAYRRADDLDAPSAAARHAQQHAVRVRLAQGAGAELKLQPVLRSMIEAVRNAGIVRLHAQQPRDERPVCAVAATGIGKRTVQQQLRPHRFLAKQPPRDKSYAHRARRMRA